MEPKPEVRVTFAELCGRDFAFFRVRSSAFLTLAGFPPNIKGTYGILRDEHIYILSIFLLKYIKAFASLYGLSLIHISINTGIKY